MSKYIPVALLTAVLAVPLLPIKTVLAVSSAPSPSCKVIADVLDVDRKKAVTPPINSDSREIEYYSVSLKILEIEEMDCKNLYPAGSIQKTIVRLDDYKKDINSMRISGRIHFSGDERFAGIFLSDISTVEMESLKPPITVKLPKVYEDKVKDIYVDKINNVDTDPDSETYIVKGVKKGKVLLFIPVEFSVELQLDAETGDVISVKKPWWSFLVR